MQKAVFTNIRYKARVMTSVNTFVVAMLVSEGHLLSMFKALLTYHFLSVCIYLSVIQEITFTLLLVY